ncbi:MAG TPA: universal stress protein [Solirubrobacteraceae bacterium]|jgi:nucleotide-binding universal stress UspA family protein|nr:universal stress protein [Solirubrobacteraceae bacterium]
MLSSAPKPTAPLPIATIGVGYNGSSRSIQALAVGRELAAAYGARIHVMEVVCPARVSNDPHATGMLSGRVDALLRQARERLAGLDGVDSCAVYGIAADELAAFGEEVDLLVVGLGSHAAGWHSLASASTSEYLQRHAPCPVLVVPRSSRLTCPEPRAPGGRGSWRALRRARLCGR